MSAPTLKLPKPRGRLQRLATLDRLATVLTWVFWLAVVVTAIQLLLALTRSGGLANPVPKSQPYSKACLASGPALLPLDLLRLGALYLAMRLARTAARDGVYTDRAAWLVLMLGWWLLAGGLVATVAEAFARVYLLSQLVTWPVDWGQWPAAWSWSWPVALIGLGLIIFARIMRVSAGMRADLEGTV